MLLSGLRFAPLVVIVTVCGMPHSLGATKEASEPLPSWDDCGRGGGTQGEDAALPRRAPLAPSTNPRACFAEHFRDCRPARVEFTMRVSMEGGFERLSAVLGPGPNGCSAYVALDIDDHAAMGPNGTFRREWAAECRSVDDSRLELAFGECDKGQGIKW